MDLRGLDDIDYNIENRPPRGIKKKFVLLFIVALLPIGNTLAANINLGGSSPIEFGQGVIVSTSCDDSISITPKVEYLNAGKKTFILSSITISDIANSCTNKAIVLGLYNDSSSVISNTYGPIAFSLNDSGTAGLHFELVGKISSIAVFGSSTIDTTNAGIGPNGSDKYLGKSSVTISRMLSSTSTNYETSEASKYTIQTTDLNNLPSFTMRDTFTESCLSVSQTNLSALDAQAFSADSKAMSMISLIDFADEQVNGFQNLSNSEKTAQSNWYYQLALTGIRITTFINTQLPSCSSRMSALALSETNQLRQDAMLEIQNATNDAIDANLAALDAFNVMKVDAASHL